MLTWYRRLLYLLPRGFREEFGEEMARVVDEHWADVKGDVGLGGTTLFWVRQGWAVVRVAVETRLRGPGRGATHHGMGGAMEGFWQDVRYALRTLVKRPLFTLVTVVTLALGIGASTTLFSAVHTVLLRPLPYPDSDEIVVVFHEDTETGERGTGLSAANARDLLENSHLLEAVAVADPWSMDLEVEGRAESLRGWAVTRSFFRAAGVDAFLGRTFLPEEYATDAAPVVLLGHGSWTTRFGADPSLVGETLTLDGTPVTVVGILPPDFRLPAEAEVWLPRPWRPRDEASRTDDYMSGLARLAPGVTLPQATAEVDRLARSLAEAHPGTNRALGFHLVPLRDHLFGEVRTPLLVLLGAVGFVLLIACANVAGLILARSAERQREYAVRGALGASEARLVRQVVVETTLLASVGCLLGILLTYAGVAGIRSLGSEHLPRIQDLEVSGAILTFAVGAAAISALLGGLMPSLRLSRPELQAVLSQGSRGSTASRSSMRLRNRLVVGEVAAAVVLLVGAGLLLKSFSVLMEEDLGFDPTDRLAVQVFAYGHPPGELSTFVNQVVAEMEALPGVERVALTSSVPGATDGRLASLDIDLPFSVEDAPPPATGEEPRAFSHQVSAGYFDVMGIEVMEGRGFLASDEPGSRPVAVVNRSFARRHFPTGGAVGSSLLLGRGDARRAWEIVGIVADVRSRGHASAPRPEVYRSLAQSGTGSLTFVLKTGGNGGALTIPAMEAIWSVNPSQSIWGAATVESLLAEWLRERRFNLVLLGAFAVVALLLATVGIYGLVSFSVEQRVSELGLRRALGGQPRDIVVLVVRDGARLALVGVMLGVGGALVLTHFMEGMLFGVEPTDPATFALLSGAVLVVASLAALVPALRALRVDPMVALGRE